VSHSQTSGVRRPDGHSSDRSLIGTAGTERAATRKHARENPRGPLPSPWRCALALLARGSDLAPRCRTWLKVSTLNPESQPRYQRSVTACLASPDKQARKAAF
jgi:hypothetical protein